MNVFPEGYIIFIGFLILFAAAFGNPFMWLFAAFGNP
jgi:hypothetical protein